jgi:hypothetical protein
MEQPFSGGLLSYPYLGRLELYYSCKKSITKIELVKLGHRGLIVRALLFLGRSLKCEKIL